MAPRSPYVDATIAATTCTIRALHPTEECEHSEEVEARRLQKLKSDLFARRIQKIPATQEEMFINPLHLSHESSLISSSMNRNYSASSFLRLPPEIRAQIYRLVLGGRQLWIDHTGSKVEIHKASGQWYHRWGKFYHDTDRGINHSMKLEVHLLRVCRHIYTETALLPYALNNFTFKDESVRKLFEQSARPGKKRAQKKAVGKYEIGTWYEFGIRHIKNL